MGRFNFSNMQNKKDTPADNSFIPVEFRDAVVEVDAKTYVPASVPPRKAPAAIPTKETPEKETFAAGGFIDETGNWNDGSSIVPQKTSDEEWNKSIAGQIVNSNAYKKYFYNREEVLKEARTMSKSLKIPENVILKDADSLAKTREIYNFQQKQMDKDAVFEAYPELSKIAAKSESDAAIALHNLQNVKETKGIVEAAKAGWEMFELSGERGRLGYAALNGAALDDKQLARIDEIDKKMKEMPKIPGLLDSPMEAIVGGSVQTGGLMVRGLFSGQKMGAYGAGFGALLGAIGGGTTTLGVGAVPGAIAGARVGYSIGTRIGAAEDMYHEIVGNNYLNFKKYKGEDGKQLLTDNEARTYAAAAAAIETGIEFSNVDQVLGVVKGSVNEKGIKAIVAAAKDNSELRSMLTAYVKNGIKNIGEVAATESAEEGIQEASNRIISNIMAANHIGGDIPEYSFEDIIGGALEASWEALPASIGLGAAAHGAGSVDMARRAAAVFSLRDEMQKTNFKNINGINMLRKLRDYFANNEFVKKNPELAQNVLEEQLTDSGLEQVSVDTDMVLNQGGGYELLKDVAAKAGIDEEQFNLIVEERMDMQIPTAVYAQHIMPGEAGEKLEDYITFDSMGECLARSRQYAARVRRMQDEIMSVDSKRREEAMNTYLDSNFKNDKEREVAEAVLMRYPDNPAAGVQELRKQLQGKIDAMLEPCLDTMRQGMGNGTAVIYTDDNHQPTTQENAAGGYRVSNNDMWYSKWYKDYGRAPSKQQMRDIAIENLIGESKYTVPGYEYQPGMEHFYEENKAQLVAIEESLERLNALAPRLEKINPGDLTITEGLSAEGFEVYKDVLSKLQQGPSKQARMAARMNAILFARMADRMAELHKAMGQKKYTALDFYNSVQLDATGNAGVGVGLNQAVNVERDFEQKYEPVDLNPLIKNMIKEQTGKDVSEEDLIAAVKALKGSGETEEENQSAINYINEILRSSDPVTTDDLLAVFDFSKMTDYDAQHIVLSKSQRGRRNKIERVSRQIVINKPKTLLKESVLVEVQPTKHSEGYYNANHEGEELYNSYRFVIPARIGTETFTLVITAVGTNEDVLQSLNEVRLYEIYAKKIPSSQRAASLKDDGIGNDSNESIPSTFSLTEMLFKVKDLNGEPYVNQETGQLNVADKFVISRKDASGTDNTLEQHAYHDSYNQSAGTMAITANTQLLEQAKNMEATGAGREEIYKATGWHKGVDGMWRFEIPDNIEKIELSKMPEPGEYVKLADIYDNPMLYAAYPVLRDISIGTENLEPTHYGYTTNGKFVLNTKFLAKYKNSVDKIKKTLDAMKGDFSKNLEKDVAKEARDIVNKIAETPENISENELRKISSLVSEDYYNYYIKPLDFDSVLFEEVSTVSEQEKNEAVYEDLINSIESYKKEKNEAQKAVAETFFHELQHIIQKEEGFASGGNYRDVRKQIDATLAAYDDEIKKMSPEAKQYYATYQSYNDVKMKYVFGQVSENRVKEIEGILREYESKVPESERNRIIRIQGMRYQLLRHKENKMLSDFEAYKNLAGEQEARAASKKAELATRIENEGLTEKVEELQKQYDDAVLNGVNEMDAIVVFNGVEVGSANAMYRNNAKDIVEFKKRILDKVAKNTYFEYDTGSGVVTIPDFSLHHIHNEHHLKDEEWQDFLEHANNIVEAYHGRSHRNQNGMPMAVKIKTPNNLFGAVLEFNSNGRVFLKTLFKGTDNSIDETIKNRGAAVRFLPKDKSAISDSQPLFSDKDAAGRFKPKGKPAIPDSQPLSIDSIQEGLGIVNKWHIPTADDAVISFGGNIISSFNAESAASSTLKGQTIIKGNGQRVIALFAAADQSTFMHEAAHLYLTELMALANMPNAPKQLLKDVETIKNWGEWQDGMMSEYKDTHLEDGFAILDKAIREASVKGSAEYNGMQLDLDTLKNIWLQERFARGFENYLKQGKAPTSALRQVFYRFKNWLCSIYKDFRKLGGAPNREVSTVMDRMIATQDEIDIELKKRGVNDFVKHGGLDYLSDDSQALYNRMIERAREEAEANVLKVALKDVREDFAKQQEELYKQVEDDYRKQLEKEPVFIIQQHLANHAGLEVSAMCEALGVSEEEYNKQIEEYGGSLDAAVDKFMDEFKADVESQPTTDAEFRAMAEEKVQEDYYRKMVTALELNAFENIAAAQRKIVSKLAKALKEEPSQDVAKAMKALTSKEKAEAGLRAVRDAAEGHYRDYVNYVKSKLETMPLSDANNYRMWRRKSSQAQQQADMAMSKGEWEKAVNFKKQQLVYDLFADEAVKSRKYTEKLEQSLLRKQATMNKNNKIPADERYVFNHLLYAFGFTNKDATVPPEYSGFTDTFMKRDETLECPFVNENGTLNLPDWILSAGTGTEQRKGKHYDLTMDQLKDLAQLLKVIYKTGMESDKLRTAKDIHGNSVGLLDAIGQIAREAAERVLPKKNRDITGAEGMTTLEKALFAANAAYVSLLKPETILRQMGPAAMRYIYEPLKAAADKELKLSEEMQKELNALFGEYSKKDLYEMRTKAKYKFGTSNITKERLIMIGLNWGTYINMKRVMDGFDISSYEVNEALSNLDKRDWKFIEGIWALYEKHWPEVQAVEARITGAVLEKQEPMPFDILGKDGNRYHLQGGYFPLKYDPTKDTTVAERAEDAAKQAGMAGFALGIGRSMTKERSMGTVTLPILLDFDVISKTLTDEIHLISFREPVRDVRRIILNDEFREVVKRLFGINTEGMLRQWSADCWALEPKAQSGYERVMSMIRANSTMAVLGYRTMTAVLNVLNITPMAHYLGGPAEAMRAMKRFYAHPKEQYEYIVQQSVFMAERAQTMDVNIREAVKRGTTADVIPGYKAVQDNAFKIIAMTDLSIAMPLWLHEYEKAYQAAMDNGLKPESAKRDAIMAGDAAVRRVFGSSQKIDLSAVQRGSEVMKMLTMYYSYFSTLYNALSYAFFQTRQQVMRAKIESGSWKKAVAANKKKLVKGLAPLAYGYLMWVLIPSLLDTLFRTAADDDDDKWSIEKLVKKTGKNILGNTVGGIPILRDAIPYLTAKAFDEPQYGMGSLPAYGTVEQLNRVINSIESDKKTKYDVARGTLRLGGTAVGFSQTLSDGLVTTVEWAGTGFEHSLAEYLTAVLLDKRLPKK